MFFIFFIFLGDSKWWAAEIPENDAKSIWYEKPNAVNIEMTSYAVLALLQAGLYEDALPAVKWLVNQRNENGGFQSTQDTIVGLQALSKFADRISSTASSVQISVKYNENLESRININADNTLITQVYNVSVF